MRISIQLATLILLLSACATRSAPSQAPQRAQDRETVRKQLPSDQALLADRESFTAMRAERQKSDDEVALFLNMMQQGSEQPQVVRDKFSVLVQKARNSFHNKAQNLRDNYRKEETTRREDFLDKQKTKRNRFVGGKPSSDDNKKFFERQDRDRQAFFADEHDRRASFESEVSAQSKDFDSYMHEKTNEFNEQFRLYSKKISERPKEKKAVTGEGVDFNSLEQTPAKPLGTDD